MKSNLNSHKLVGEFNNWTFSIIDTFIFNVFYFNLLLEVIYNLYTLYLSLKKPDALIFT